MARIVTTSVPVSGTCGHCGTHNHATATATGPAGRSISTVAAATCGNCGSSVTLTGSAHS